MVTHDPETITEKKSAVNGSSFTESVVEKAALERLEVDQAGVGMSVAERLRPPLDLAEEVACSPPNQFAPALL